MKSFRNPVQLSFFIIIFLVTAFAYMHRWVGNDGYGWEATIDGDSKGYYAFLPAVFIYNDLAFDFFNEPQNASIKRYYHPRFRVETEGGFVNKNYVGVAVLISPFFLLAHSVAWLSDVEQTGYSWPYMLGVICAALFYLLAGIYFMVRLIRTFSLSEGSAAITGIALSAGTILFYYTSIHSAMAHVYSFFSISLFSFYIRIFFINHRLQDLLLAAFFLGLITIVRPMNLIILAALPFLAGSKENLVRTFFVIARKPLYILSTIPVFAIVIFIQLVTFKIQTGSWFVWSYGDEGFNFSNPEIINVLFSFRKGLFIYSPVLLILIPGLFLMIRKSIFTGSAFAGFFMILVYVISSWWNWFYGDGFGQRAFIDFFPLFSIPIAVVIDRMLNNKMRLLAVLLPMLFIAYNIIQTYQYRYRIIHPDSMNFEKYRHIFLKTGEKYRDIFSGNPDIIYNKISEIPVATYKFGFMNGEMRWCKNCNGKFSGTEVGFDNSNEYGMSMEGLIADLNLQRNGVFVKAELQRVELEINSCSEAYLVCSVEKPSGDVEFWTGVRLNELPSNVSNEWRTRNFGFHLPGTLNQESKFKIFIWNKNKQLFRIKDFEVGFYPVIKRN